MKRIILIFLLLMIFVGSVFAFLEGRKEMQKEREREKPVDTPPRVKATSNGSVIEFDGPTLAISGIVAEKTSGPISVNCIVTADGKPWYYAEVSPRVFLRKPCSSEACVVSDETIVTRGAQMLLSEERKNIIKIGEDGGGN